MNRKYEIKLILIGVSILLVLTCAMAFIPDMANNEIQVQAQVVIIFFGYNLITLH
ncbi:hypothetical protein [Chitinophaga polysaccharea]|uniref:hypothetical protein n=1 Tax=Chitinophaga polysaccharea TaxID=1293035 RepID=UPI001644BF71|nr:hypothetical protein [Chitinophaga polysaccharea]